MNRQGLYFVCFWLLTGATSLFAQQQLGTVNGIVRSVNGERLQGANIQIADRPNSSAISNSQGMYRIDNLPYGNYQMKVSHLGYEVNVVSFSIQSVITQTVDVQLIPTVYNTESVTVTGVRAREDAPFTQVTRNRAEIERVYTGQDGAFLIEELSPSVVSYSESGTGLSNYAGFRLRGIDQSRVNLTLNGVPLNDMVDQGVFFSNFTDFGNSIESVQIQRGVGTSSNGTSSYAGSINFESLSLLDTAAHAQIQLTGGSFNTRRASAEVSTGKMENNMAFYARLSHTNADGFRDNMSTNSSSIFFSGAYFHKKHTLKFTGFMGRSANGLGYRPVALEDINMNPRTNYVSPNDIDNFGQWMSQLQHNFQINNDLNIVSTLYYSGAGGDFPYGFSDEDGNFMQINYPLYNDHVGVMSNLNGSVLNDIIKFNTGVHANSFLRRNIEQMIPLYDAPYYSDQSRKDEVSAFAKGSIELGRFELFGDVQARAVRLELTPDEDFLGVEASIPAREWLFINPKIGMTFKIDNSLQAYASFGRTGREPTRFDILGSTQINNDNLPIAADVNQVVPEFVNNIEVGMRMRSNMAYVQANFFYMKFENEIAPIGEFIPESFVQVYKNQESSYRAGGEVDYRVDLTHNFRILGNATYMRAEIKSYTPEGSTETFNNVTPILSPEWNVQTTVEYDVIKPLSIGLRGRYLSSAYMELTNNPDLTVPESFVMDLRLRYRFHKEHSLSIQLNNLLDTQYFTYGAPVFMMDGNVAPGYFVQPPRHIYATLQLCF